MPTKTVPPPGGRANPDARHLRKKSHSQKKGRKRAPSATSIAPTQPPTKKARVEEIEDDDAAGSPRVSTMSTTITDPGPGALGISNRTKAKVY